MHPKVAVLFRILRNHGIEFEFAKLKLSKGAEKLALDTVASKTEQGTDGDVESQLDLVDIKREAGTAGDGAEAAINPKVVEELMKVQL